MGEEFTITCKEEFDALKKEGKIPKNIYWRKGISPYRVIFNAKNGCKSVYAGSFKNLNDAVAARDEYLETGIRSNVDPEARRSAEIRLKEFITEIDEILKQSELSRNKREFILEVMEKELPKIPSNKLSEKRKSIRLHAEKLLG